MIYNSVAKFFKWCVLLFIISIVIFVGKTALDFTSPYPEFHSIRSDAHNLQILDRNSNPLTFSYQNRWNTYDNISLHEIPEIFQQAFIFAEDKRFFEHRGVDWQARINALLERVQFNNRSRGASTITEQVVRMLHPRERSYWAKWIEGLEAIALETKVSKADILEFYLNQVPYASNRRGIVQAARFYFDRNLNTLSTKEMLALAVLVRAPSKFDLYSAKIQIDDSINRLANKLAEHNILEIESVLNMKKHKLVLNASKPSTFSFHFVRYVREHTANEGINNQSKIVTTLDSNLQQFVEALLENRLKSLASRNINNAAAIVIDSKNNEIIAWVSIGAQCKATINKAPGCLIDMVTAPRQPGSALKPFLYAAALEKGWSAITIIDDLPYSNRIGQGIHHFHNYSNIYYGKVTLRTALGNSLNIPALHTINYVTPEKYLSILQNLGFNSLTQSANFYDEGLALGNGEVTLFELVQAYSTFTNQGIFSPLKVTFYRNLPLEKKYIYSEETASLIGNILSDPWARNLEFSRSSVLNLPTQTAVKTGTSSDYRDAWAIGYNYRYVVGIWMGNSDYSPTDGVTGSLGPSLVLRSIFNELTKNVETQPLYISSKLIAKDVCINPEDLENNNLNCAMHTEYFASEKEEKSVSVNTNNKIGIIRPTNGLEMAIDPRIPADKQAFEMRLSGTLETDTVEWFIDNKKQESISGKTFLWPTKIGKHYVEAIIWRNGDIFAKTAKHTFNVR